MESDKLSCILKSDSLLESLDSTKRGSGGGDGREIGKRRGDGEEEEKEKSHLEH